MIAYRHGKWKVNLCFWDGHAEPMNKDDIIVGDRDGLNTADYDGTVDTSVQGSNEHFHKYWLMWAE